MSNRSNHPFLQLGIFRLEDMCIRLQDGMEAYLPTAALEKVPEIDATFRWLRKRGVRIALLSDHNRQDTELILRRVGWRVGSEEMLELVLTSQQSYADPISTVLEYVGLVDPRRAFALVDTPRLLGCATANELRYVLGVLNGRHGYSALAKAPHASLLDEPVQLANYLLSSLAPPHATAPASAPRPYGA